MITEGPPRRRRNGAELEAALLDAAWGELLATGYARLTMGSVAARARTSEAVLYRRWTNKDELVLAAFEHHRKCNPVIASDTGSLRGDLIAYLSALSEAFAGYFAIAMAAVHSGLDTGLTLAEARDKIMATQQLPSTRPLYQRAHDRGDLDLTVYPPAVLELPFDLLRHDLLMSVDAIPPDRIRSIVDELVLPLLRAWAYGAKRSCRSTN